jgi:hypothetical protein
VGCAGSFSSVHVSLYVSGNMPMYMSGDMPMYVSGDMPTYVSGEVHTHMYLVGHPYTLSDVSYWT